MKILIAFLTAYALLSPNGKLEIKIDCSDAVRYSVTSEGTPLIEDSEISMTLENGVVWGGKIKPSSVTRKSVDTSLKADLYKKSTVQDKYNEMTLSFPKFRIVARAYDDGVAYRFVSRLRKGCRVVDERASFDFAEDFNAWIPYVRHKKKVTLEAQFHNSFENTYEHRSLSKWDAARLAFLPLVIDAPAGKKICIAESDIHHYPGMFLSNTDADSALNGVFAPLPSKTRIGGRNNREILVEERYDYLTDAAAGAAFPWRIIAVAENDDALLCNDMVYRLAASPSLSEPSDWSWVKPGHSAWDWWSDWYLYGVDFKAGINKETYFYFIDFAASHNIPYVVIDDGWYVPDSADMDRIVPELELPSILKYAGECGVGIILWTSYSALNKDIEGYCAKFAAMGAKGFKVDFINRNDALAVDFVEKVAVAAARNGMIVDFHGIFAPFGFNRKFPNVLNFEGVYGLEQVKWGKEPVMVENELCIPFARMFAGPADFTQGAMRNAIEKSYRPVNSEPMSQGTRCRQLAEYVIFDAPLSMLCDSPSNYLAERECTSFICGVPTVWDEMHSFDSVMGEYVCQARRKGDDWWIGAIGGWTASDRSLRLDFLPEGRYSVEIFRDGVNADRAACDYKREIVAVHSGEALDFHLAPGGGFAAKLTKL